MHRLIGRYRPRSRHRKSLASLQFDVSFRTSVFIVYSLCAERAINYGVVLGLVLDVVVGY